MPPSPSLKFCGAGVNTEYPPPNHLASTQLGRWESAPPLSWLGVLYSLAGAHSARTRVKVPNCCEGFSCSR